MSEAEAQQVATETPISLGAGQRCCGHGCIALHQESSASFVFAFAQHPTCMYNPCPGSMPRGPSEASPEVELIQDLRCFHDTSHRQLKTSSRTRATEGRSNSAQPCGTVPVQPYPDSL